MLSEVDQAADVVDDEVSDGIVKEAVYGKIATLGVFPGGPEGVGAHDETGVVVGDLLVRREAAKGRDFKDRIPSVEVRQAKATADDAAATTEDGLQLFGARVRGDVEVLGPAMQEEIPN